MENKELPEGLVDNIEKEKNNLFKIELNKTGFFAEKRIDDIYNKTARRFWNKAWKAALSVIAPHYEKQIEELKDIIKNGEHVNFYDINEEELAELTLFFEKVMREHNTTSFSIFQTICHLKAIKAKPPAE